MNRKSIIVLALISAMPLYAEADAIGEVEANYKTEGAVEFSAAAGEAFWTKAFVDAKTGQERSCKTCHTTDLRKPGKHAKTGKVIDPMAPSVNAERFSDVKKIEKWFLRNCKWTTGRECTPQEKGDVLAFIKSIK